MFKFFEKFFLNEFNFMNNVSIFLHNNGLVRDLSPLRGLTNLETLVLDNNQLTSHCKLPPLPRLHTLWVNKNKISNLTAFIERVEQQAPNLKFLSMLGNEACPNYFNSGTPKQYKDYR
jgi:Leucine-rich repeat (LRR) protein